MTSAALRRKSTGSPTGRTTSWAGSRGWSLEGEAGLDEMVTPASWYVPVCSSKVPGSL